MGKKEENINYNSNFYIKIILTMLVLILIILTTYKFYFYSDLGIGDLVYKKDSGLEIGKIEGIGILKTSFLINWQDDSYTTETYRNIESINKINSYKINNSLNQELIVSETNFSDYDLVKSSNSINSGNSILLYEKSFSKLIYNNPSSCKPNFECTSWGECQIDYNLNSLIFNEELTGIQYKYCKDLNKCFPDIMDSKVCTVTSNVDVEVINFCNEKTILLKQEGKILSVLTNKNKNDYININLNFNDELNCWYCNNNIRDYDEEAIDCGGSCKPCLLY